MDDSALQAALRAEFERLGLKVENFPGGGLAGDRDALEGWLERLRASAPGATWRDVLPDLPAHWQPGRPETWTTPYLPLGPYDYQELPTGPAVHVNWPKGTDRGCLEALMSDARGAGWPIYGAGFLEAPNAAWSTLDAFLVMERGTPEEVLCDFVTWIEEQPGVTLAAIPRIGNEDYTG